MRGVRPNRRSMTSGSHPVDIPYRLTNHFADGPLTPRFSLDTRVRLFDSNITCASCHSPYATQPALLVMSNQGSRLCLSCHQY